MEVILTEDVRNLGEMGEIVKVAPGYGRNYLIPQGLAVPATGSHKKELDHKLSEIEARREREREAARAILGDIDGISITLAKRASEEHRLYGSVTPREIADVLVQQGQEVHHKQVDIEGNIEELGIYKVPIKLASGIYAYVRVWVVAM